MIANLICLYRMVIFMDFPLCDVTSSKGLTSGAGIASGEAIPDTISVTGISSGLSNMIGN